jgi:hypothetical protein
MGVIPFETRMYLRTPTATLGGPFATRTPSSPHACPPPDERATIAFPEDIYSVEMDERLLAFFNAGGTAFRLRSALDQLSGEYEYVRAEVETVDLTGDRVPEVIVHGIGTGSVVFGCQDGRYEARFRLPPDATGLSGYVEEIVDMNANGVPEVLWSWTEFGANDVYIYYYIEEWDGDGFRRLISPRWTGQVTAEMFNGFHRLRDTDANGTLELVIRGDVDGGLSACGTIQRERTDTWMWNGEHFVLERMEYEPPVFRYQAVADGDAALLEYSFEEALAHYQKAIFDVTLQPSNWFPPQPDYCGMEGGFYLEFEGFDPLVERARLEAYSRYRIVLLHAAMETKDAGRVVYDTLQRKFPRGATGATFAELAQVFWVEFQATGSAPSACTAALEFAAPLQEELMVQLLDVVSDALYRPSGYPEDLVRPIYLCPFR